MTGPQITIALTGPHRGYVVATMPAPDEHTFPARLLVGDVRDNSGDGHGEKWLAWLWPKAGGEMHVTQHCEALHAATPEQLADRLQRHANRLGEWWR